MWGDSDKLINHEKKSKSSTFSASLLCQYMTFYYFQIGDIIYARLCVANKDMEPELDCRDGSGKSSGMGQLAGGFMITCSLGLCRK